MTGIEKVKKLTVRVVVQDCTGIVHLHDFKGHPFKVERNQELLMELLWKTER